MRDIIVGLCIFAVSALTIIAIFARAREPDLGWDKDPLPKQAEDAALFPDDVEEPAEFTTTPGGETLGHDPSMTVVMDSNKLDLQI